MNNDKILLEKKEGKWIRIAPKPKHENWMKYLLSKENIATDIMNCNVHRSFNFTSSNRLLIRIDIQWSTVHTTEKDGTIINFEKTEQLKES